MPVGIPSAAMCTVRSGTTDRTFGFAPKRGRGLGRALEDEAVERVPVDLPDPATGRGGHRPRPLDRVPAPLERDDPAGRGGSRGGIAGDRDADRLGGRRPGRQHHEDQHRDRDARPEHSGCGSAHRVPGVRRRTGRWAASVSLRHSAVNTGDVRSPSSVVHQGAERMSAAGRYPDEPGPKDGAASARLRPGGWAARVRRSVAAAACR